jgi:glycosyltransferase involved in cell wall biosynthesis
VRPAPDGDVPLHIVTVAGRKQPNLFWYRTAELRSVIRAVRPEIIDIHEEPYSLAAGAALWAARLESPGVKICVYTAQNLDKHYPPPFSWIERRTLAVASAAYPCSIEAGQRLMSRGFTGAIRVLPLGVTVPPPTSRRPGTTRVGFVGRLEPYKGGTIAIRAFLAAAATTDAELAVIGDGTEAEAMRAAVSEAAAADRVVFTGALSQSETLTRINELDVLLVPSLTTPTWKAGDGRRGGRCCLGLRFPSRSRRRCWDARPRG